MPAIPRSCAAFALVAAQMAIAGLSSAQARESSLLEQVDRRARDLEAKVVGWRRDIHQHPELSYQEVRTARLVADHLTSLGLEVQTGVARTGVVGVLRGARPGPVVALRADMDALPVTEEVDLPFRSRVRATWEGQEVGVMHACGHDNHVAILMGVAELLAGMRSELRGTVKFIFQPSEEGAPLGQDGGAKTMIAQGVLENPKVDAIFGLHVFPFPVGSVVYKPEGLMASSDQFRIVLRGRQTHGALPWNGIDPIVLAAQLIGNMQTIVSRNTDLTLTPAILTVGYIRGGVRVNIIPDSVEMGGTIRTFDEATRDSMHVRLRRLVEGLAAANGARASVLIDRLTPVTWNDPPLVTRMAPVLRSALGSDRVSIGRPTTTAEDFSYYQQRVPGFFYFLGVTPPDADPAIVAPNHSPRFFADERALVPGMKSLALLALEYAERR